MKAISKKTTRVIALVAPGSANNGRYDFDFSLWKPLDRSSTMLFSREFDAACDDHALLKSMEELQKIILALFLTDSIPRRIYFFEYDLAQENQITFWRVFGHPQAAHETEEHFLVKAFNRVGIFNQSRTNYFFADQAVIKSWFDFLLQNPVISSGLQLIQESFGLSHELSSGPRIMNFSELSTVLLLLVSGLESLFTHASDSTADISFKFRTVGAAFYSRFVTESSLENIPGPRKGKIPFSDFKTILGILYNLRSSIAHGGFGFDFFNDKNIRKDLDKLFETVGIAAIEKTMKSMYFAHLLIAVEILEAHLLALFRTAKDNLNKGVNILDEMLDDKNIQPADQ